MPASLRSLLQARLHADRSRHIGADEYFPVLVFVILQATPHETRHRHLGMHMHIACVQICTHVHACMCASVVLQANPPQLLSTISFISRFRSPEALRSLEGCYYTHFRAAVAFLETFDFEDLAAAEDVQRQLKDFAGRAEVHEAAWERDPPLAASAGTSMQDLDIL